MTNRYPGDGGPTWVKDLGGDGLTRRTLTHHAPGEGEDVLRDQMKGDLTGSFKRRLETILAHCDEVLASHSWIREENGKRLFPGDHDCQPYSDLWYAGRIGMLCWLALSYDHYLVGDIGLNRAMTIGAEYTEWKWRHLYRPAILTGAPQRKHLRALRDAKNKKARRIVEERRRLVALLLSQTKRTGAALDAWLVEELGRSGFLVGERTVREDVRAVRSR